MTDPVANFIGQIPIGAATGPSNAQPSAPAASLNTLSLSDAQRTLLASILDPVVPGRKTSHDLLISTLIAIQSVFASFKDDDYLQSIIDKNIMSGHSDFFAFLEKASKTAQAKRISAETDKEIIDPLTTSLTDLETQINAAQPGYLNLLNTLNTKITAYNSAVQNVKDKLAALNPNVASTVNDYKSAVAALNSAAGDYNSAMTALQNVNNQYDANFPGKNLPYLLNQYNQTLLDLKVAITNKNSTIALWNSQYANGDQPPAELQPMPAETLGPIIQFSSPSFINSAALAPPKATSFESPVFYNLQPLHSTPVAGGGSANLQSQIAIFNGYASSYNSQLTNLGSLKTTYSTALNNLRSLAANANTTTAAYNTAVNAANTAATNYNNALSSVFNKLTLMQTQATTVNNLISTEAETTSLSPVTPIASSLNQTTSALQENFFFYTAATVSSNNVPTPKDLVIPALIPSLVPTSAVQNFTIPAPLPPELNFSFQDLVNQIVLSILNLAALIFSGKNLNDQIMELSKNRTDQAIIYILSALSGESTDTAQFKVATNAIANQGTNVESSTTHLSSAQLDVVLNNILSSQTFNAVIEQALLTNPSIKGLLPTGDQITSALNQKVIALITNLVKSSLLISVQYLQNVLHKDQIDILSALAQGGVILEQILGVLAQGASVELLKSLGLDNLQGGAFLNNTLKAAILQLGAILYGEATGNRALFLEQQAIQQSFINREASIIEKDIKYTLERADATEKRRLVNDLQKALIQEGVAALKAEDIIFQILAGNQSLDLTLSQNNLQHLLPIIDQTQQLTQYENTLQALANKSSTNAPLTSSINRPVSNTTAAAVKEKVEESLIASGISKEEAASKALQIAQELQKFSAEDSISLRVIKIRQLLDAALPNANLSTNLLPVVVAQLLSGAQKEQLVNFIGEQTSLERVDALVKQQSSAIDRLNELVSKTLAEQRALADANNLAHVLDSNLLKYDKLLHVNSLVNKLLDPGSRLTFFGLMYESATNEFKRGYIDIRA